MSLDSQGLFLFISSTEYRLVKSFGKVFGRDSECAPYHNFHTRESEEIIYKAKEKLPANAVSYGRYNANGAGKQTKKRSGHARGVGPGKVMYAYACNMDDGFKDPKDGGYN